MESESAENGNVVKIYQNKFSSGIDHMHSRHNRSTNEYI